MPNFQDRIDGFVVGDRLKVQRFFDGLSVGVSMTKAWFTVKKTPLEDDPAAIVLLSVTATPTASGAVLNTGAATQVAQVEFILSPTLTALLSREYEFEIQVLLSDGTINTPIQGKIKGRAQLTRATS